MAFAACDEGQGPLFVPSCLCLAGGCVRTVFQCSQLEEEAHGAARDKLRSCEPTRGLGRREKGMQGWRLGQSTRGLWRIGTRGSRQGCMGRRWMGSRGWELTVELGDEKPLMQVVWTVSSRQGRTGL